MGEWKRVKLGEICSKIGSGATPTGGKSAYKDDGVSLIRSQNVLDMSFAMAGLAHIDDEQAKISSSKQYFFAMGMILSLFSWIAAWSETARVIPMPSSAKALIPGTMPQVESVIFLGLIF